ncbi:hypothetical protein COX08_04685 [Candidatus Beckwithbacteria bacterium CG23_combo_of_CG06-09_8_20_14_all_34_8]|uniref:HTH merR-type domain-containing protein n=1 Tax=Candidatus Beckwithbacteria bacterium CG23_combo_of_CG06-09_8_20_14_all_34_8 TaxID=1974497 RepID=A0A2H0B525_9BACT|nr:MAG: hypothetical protein COX08_04685 [Candidatus Beckwithbacteria bacterium CG23_combo_of_CG06-09_8_20_14_all_34_8]
MLTTQQFADLCDTTKKTILYYDRIGLLKPVMLSNNSRKYEIKQVLHFQKIVLLKSFGFSLDEIKEIIQSNDFNQIFNNRKQKLEQQQEKLSQKLRLVQKYLHNLKNKQFLINPKVKTVGPYRYYAIRRVGRYVDINRFDQELSKLINDTKFKRIYFTIFHTLTYAPDQCDMTVAALIEEKDPKQYPQTEIKLVPKQKVVSYAHVGSYRYLSYVWQFLGKFVQDKKFCPNPDYPDREFYRIGGLVEKNEDKLVTELQVPIK